MLHEAASHRMRSFYLTWFGLMVSQLGSGLTGFALSVWVYQQTGSSTTLTFVLFFSTIPMVVSLPIAGALVDRWDRRRALILSEAGASLTPLFLAALLAVGRLEIWHIYVVVTVSACFRAFQFPAFSAATTQLVPKEQLGRAAGMAQLGLGIAQLVSPMLGGALLAQIGLRGVFWLDLASFVVPLALLPFVRIPPPATSAEGRAGRGALGREIAYGFRYILARRGLLALLLLIGTGNYVGCAVVALAPPLVLSFADARVLGTVMSVAGIGMLASAVLMSVWKGPRRRVPALFVGLLLTSVPTAVAGLAPSALLIGAAACVGAAGGPLLNACSQAIWQRKVPPDLQGRVFATRAMIATSFGPLAYATSGPLADYVFNPLLVEGGTLAASVGQVLGVGPARGIGLQFVVLGLVGVLFVVAGYFYAPLRRVEAELPDAIPDDPARSAPGPTAAGAPGSTAAAGAAAPRSRDGLQDELAP
ncbi:MFS transporter [Sorangium sp. So ce291]|uniref:MFS transporter n=1 Tax=Sorangium sp. So ce291 TaxID=3133294 RepID=UPI003F6108F2